MSIRAALAWSRRLLRHPVTILTWNRWVESTGFCMEDITDMVAEPVELMWNGAYSGVTVAIDDWTCQINGGAGQLRRLADLLNDRADQCDILTATLTHKDGNR